MVPTLFAVGVGAPIRPATVKVAPEIVIVLVPPPLVMLPLTFMLAPLLRVSVPLAT